MARPRLNSCPSPRTTLLYHPGRLCTSLDLHLLLVVMSVSVAVVVVVMAVKVKVARQRSLPPVLDLARRPW